MLKTIRNSKLLNYFWVAMLLYIFNCSVDTPDLGGNFSPENLRLNDQESIVEIVAEKLLGFENAIPESDDADYEDTSIKKSISLDSFTIVGTIHEIPLRLFIQRKFSNVYAESFLEVSEEKNSPPPEV